MVQDRVKMLGFEIGNKLFFEQYISALYKKVSNQLNVIWRIQKNMGFKGNVSFKLFYQTLIAVLLLGISVL